MFRASGDTDTGRQIHKDRAPAFALVLVIVNVSTGADPTRDPVILFFQKLKAKQNRTELTFGRMTKTKRRFKRLARRNGMIKRTQQNSFIVTVDAVVPRGLQ